MQDRILKLINELDVSSTKLAEEIGVQRSSISHILSGRNKPSFDFIQKLLKRYPKINAKWLMLGEGPVFAENIQSSLPFQDTGSQSGEPLTSRESNIQNQPRTDHQIGKSDTRKKATTEPVIKKIVIFYTDNSFEEYHPKENK